MTLPVVLHQAPHEKKAVERLVRYCRDLDGTEIKVFSFTEPAGMRYPANANWSFRQVAKEMRGQPFMWLEADSPVLVAGWLEKLTKEYKKIGKPYLYAKQFNPPFDRFSGIGIQGPDAYDQQPEEAWTDGGFDEWVCVNYPEQVGRTDLIRHSYGLYDAMGQVQHHEFPRDMHIIGKEAVIFHPDKKLQLCDIVLPGKDYSIKTHHVTSVGDLGDCTVSLPTIMHKGGMTTYFLRDNGSTKGIVNRAHIIRPLLEAQPYIDSVKIWRNESVDWASEGFRPGWHNRISNLAQCHAQHALDTGFIQTLPDLSKAWLVAEPDKKWEGRIIVNRSPRYNNPQFPWHKIVKHYGSRLVFVGLAEEHQNFVRSFGQVQYRPTLNLLEIAQMIAASSLFIGNQSACMTIAEGLKHPRILEGSLHIPDCIYPKAHNAQYVFNGQMELPDIDSSGSLLIPPHTASLDQFKTLKMPRSPKGDYGWQFDLPGGKLMESTYQSAAKRVSKALGIDYDEAERQVIAHNVRLSPNFFQTLVDNSYLHQASAALRHYGYTDHPACRVDMAQIVSAL